MEMVNLQVPTEFRRQGIGAKLVTAAVQAMQARGVQHMTLEAKSTASGIGRLALAGMYRKLGFRVAGFSSDGNDSMERGVAPIRNIPAAPHFLITHSIQRMKKDDPPRKRESSKEMMARWGKVSNQEMPKPKKAYSTEDHLMHHEKETRSAIATNEGTNIAIEKRTEWHEQNLFASKSDLIAKLRAALTELRACATLQELHRVLTDVGDSVKWLRDIGKASGLPEFARETLNRKVEAHQMGRLIALSRDLKKSSILVLQRIVKARNGLAHYYNREIAGKYARQGLNSEAVGAELQGLVGRQLDLSIPSAWTESRDALSPPVLLQCCVDVISGVRELLQVLEPQTASDQAPAASAAVPADQSAAAAPPTAHGYPPTSGGTPPRPAFPHQGGYQPYYQQAHYPPPFIPSPAYTGGGYSSASDAALPPTAPSVGYGYPPYYYPPPPYYFLPPAPAPSLPGPPGVGRGQPMPGARGNPGPPPAGGGRGRSVSPLNRYQPYNK
jgi:hypothetical protein